MHRVTNVVLVDAITTTIPIAVPVAGTALSKQTKSATEIVLPRATTPTIAPPTPSMVRPIPAMLFARMSR